MSTQLHQVKNLKQLVGIRLEGLKLFEVMMRPVSDHEIWLTYSNSRD